MGGMGIETGMLDLGYNKAREKYYKMLQGCILEVLYMHFISR